MLSNKIKQSYSQYTDCAVSVFFSCVFHQFSHHTHFLLLHLSHSTHAPPSRPPYTEPLFHLIIDPMMSFHDQFPLLITTPTHLLPSIDESIKTSHLLLLLSLIFSPLPYSESNFRLTTLLFPTFPLITNTSYTYYSNQYHRPVSHYL